MAKPDDLSQRWPNLNALLDEPLALPESERTIWLDSLQRAPAELKNTLREMLVEQTRAVDETGLPTVKRLARSGSPASRIKEPAPGDMIGPYCLISELGRGGMGAVWLAERADGRPKRHVALKLPHLVRGGALSERLAHERDILASLEHPHIARLYDAGVDRHGRPYPAMEYVEGEAIDVFCSTRALPVRERIGLLLQVAAAVAHAHARLVVHRDLKPGNILVTADGQVRLLDFGIAKLMEGDRTQETSLTLLSGRALTLDYASPEQVRGEALGTASDVYSLGVVAYELLAGARPYRLKRASAAELEEAIASVDPPLASDSARDREVRRQLKGDIDAILNKALKKETSQRYATVEALAQDLRRHLNYQPVFAQPDSLDYRIGKFIKRYRLPVAAGGVAILALLGGAGLALSQAQRARTQAARAEEVKRLVLSIFKDADTSADGSRKTTAADLLEQARSRLDAVPVSDPVIRAELLTSLGISLTGLGEYQQAEKVLDQATQLAVAHLGQNHPDTAAAQLAFGEALIETGQAPRAGQYLDAAEPCDAPATSRVWSTLSGGRRIWTWIRGASKRRSRRRPRPCSSPTHG
jgi:tRNA A-37 threonylcarbamoyl transferase component Bud32/5-carboxymethyl-2-hydroxymuconate isomerase